MRHFKDVARSGQIFALAGAASAKTEHVWNLLLKTPPGFDGLLRKIQRVV
jgi:hypothetical protein